MRNRSGARPLYHVPDRLDGRARGPVDFSLAEFIIGQVISVNGGLHMP